MTFRWANESGAAGLPRVTDLEKAGWVKVATHPVWPSSWLMREGEAKV